MTAIDYETHYREGKEIEAREEGALTAELIEKLTDAIREAKAERGKVTIVCSHEDRLFINVHGALSRGGEDRYQLRREICHYL